MVSIETQSSGNILRSRGQLCSSIAGDSATKNTAYFNFHHTVIFFATYLKTTLNWDIARSWEINYYVNH